MATAPTPEQAVRDVLDEMGVDDAQSFTAGEAVILANLFGNIRWLRRLVGEGADPRAAIDAILDWAARRGVCEPPGKARTAETEGEEPSVGRLLASLRAAIADPARPASPKWHDVGHGNHVLQRVTADSEPRDIAILWRDEAPLDRRKREAEARAALAALRDLEAILGVGEPLPERAAAPEICPHCGNRPDALCNATMGSVS